MKLQVKDSGAWRNVVSFNEAQETGVLATASHLLRLLDNRRITMRTIEGEKALRYCEWPRFEWRDA